MKSLTVVVAAFLALAAGAAQAHGQTSPSRGARVPGEQDGRVTSLTVDEAVARALATSHRVAEVRATLEGTRAVVQGREAAAWPILTTLAGYTRTNHVPAFGIPQPGRGLEVIYPDIPDNYRGRLDVQWPIYTFGRTSALERMAKAEAEATAKDLETARADLKLEVTRAFWSVVTAREAARVVEESLKRMDASLQDVRNRLQVGLVPPNDVLSVQAQRSRQQMLLIQARNQLDLTVADLARLVGLPPGSAVEPQASLEAGPAPSLVVGALVSEARLRRPERQALSSRVVEAGERRHAAIASERPSLTAGGGVDIARPNPRFFPRIAEFQASWDASINISWVLKDFGRTQADIAEATAGHVAMSERLAEFDSGLEVEVRQRALELVSSRAAVGAAEDAVKAAAEARRVVAERFAAGVATSTDVLDAQVALLQAELDRTQALATVRLNEARLDRAIGK